MTNEATGKEYPIQANRQPYGGWVEGKIAEWRFQAKVYDEGSDYGIDGGRVSKLAIWEEAQSSYDPDFFVKEEILAYDRGWDLEPPTDTHREMLRQLLAYLEQLPTSEKEEYTTATTYHTVFARKAVDYGDMLSLIAQGERENYGSRDYYIADEIMLSAAEWASLKRQMLENRGWLTAYNSKGYGTTFPNFSAVPCLLVRNDADDDTLVIDTQGYDYPRYVGIHADEEV